MVFVNQEGAGCGEDVEIVDEVVVGLAHCVAGVDPCQPHLLAGFLPPVDVFGDGDGEHLEVVLIGVFEVELV